MNLYFDTSRVINYHSNSQIMRVLTESWVEDNMFCPRCGNIHINKFENNKPVADFFCPSCKCQFELKSTKRQKLQKINDGAYSTMIERITSNQNPDFLFMNYSKECLKIKNLIMIPKYFFVPEIIEKRNPLSKKAKRSGWTGCNIMINKIPEQGIIFIIRNSLVRPIDNIISDVIKIDSLKTSDIVARGWLMDILKCLNAIPSDLFSLSEMYEFENILSQIYPNNRNIKSKIRQQLQILRDKKYIEFIGNGLYKKI